MMAPAHLPVLKPQQPDAQSASLVHWPVMNCEPLALPTFCEPGMLVLTVVVPPVEPVLPVEPVEPVDPVFPVLPVAPMVGRAVLAGLVG